MMYKLYNFYSNWTFLLSLFEQWTKIYTYPSVVVSFIVSTILCLIYKTTFFFFFFSTVYHLLPLMWCKKKYNNKILIVNLMLGLLYLGFINLQNKTIFEIYHNHMNYFRSFNYKKVVSEIKKNF